ncbi:hypothetical protein [Salinimonas iocasae]|uniref:Uncharacterized protein n=1 Tax=Salinimonas iocasae TaxID=2572577 RepID=A0A5B7YGE4_9ALTE|nr:hypothetical protein [Salinimonas iocasae]QCZ94363.1 hypothetical protein FBQ74_13175 [Salinimonas iocasae]
MFGWLKRKKKKEKRKKKNPIKEMIDARGLKPCALVLAGVIWERISNAEVAYQFVLEELGAAHNGNDAAQAFAKQSGIAFKSYEGAMQRIWSAIDGPDGPQQRLLQTCAMLKAYPDLIVALRIAIVDATMSRYELGKYDTTLNQKDKENDFAVNDPFEVESSGQATEVLAQVIER